MKVAVVKNEFDEILAIMVLDRTGLRAAGQGGVSKAICHYIEKGIHTRIGPRLETEIIAKPNEPERIFDAIVQFYTENYGWWITVAQETNLS